MYRKANKYLVLLVSFLIFGFTQGRKEIIALSDVSAEGLKSFEIKSFSNRLESELVNLNKYDVTSRQEIDKIINEQKFQYSGCTDQQCAAEIGKMLNADIMLLSNILYDKDSKYLNITLKIVDVESAKIRTALSKDIMNNTIIQSLDNIEQYLKELYRKDNQSDQPEIIINPNIQQKGLGNINITTDPIGSNVILDNESKGLSPLFLEKIEEGSHRIILNFEGYERVAEVVTVYTDSTVNVNKKLVPLTGHLTIKSTPSGADIFINEEYKGKAPLDLEYLDVGSYYITFKMEGYEETFQPVSVDWNQDNLVNQKLVPLPAKVAFFSVPTGADVYVDSKIMGKTDNAGLILEIQAGSHTIKMKKKGYEPETININPSPGENIDVDLSLEKLPQGVSDNPLAGWVSLTGSPSDALIKYNGNIINAPAKFLELEKGRYNFKVSREGYKSTTQSVLLAPRKHQEIKYQLYPVDKYKAQKLAMYFPGLGHYYSEKPVRGFIWSSIQVACIAGFSMLLDDYLQKNIDTNNAYDSYMSARDVDDINQKSTIYQNAFSERNNTLYALITVGVVNIGNWIYNIVDVKKVNEENEEKN